MSQEINEPKEIRQYLERLELSMQAVQRRLKRFEDEFGMDSEQFFRRLHAQRADLNERLQYSEWAGEHEMLQRLRKQRADLKRKLGEKP
jgi:hypothetical protein